MVRLLGNTPEKGELIRRAASMDFRALGDAYRSSTAGYERSRPRFIDKTPINYLYLGLIRMRGAGGSYCAAILWKAASRRHFARCSGPVHPFSYDLSDPGETAYHRLMQHWRRVMPDAFIDVDYESLVANQVRADPALRARLRACVPRVS